MILSSITIASSGVLVTGAGDSSVKIWEVGESRGRRRGRGVSVIEEGGLGLVCEVEGELEAEGADGTLYLPVCPCDDN